MLETMAEAEGVASESSLVERFIRLMYAEHPLIATLKRRRH